MHRILTRLAAGEADASELALLERLAKSVRSAAVCGMGGMAPGATLSTLSYFRDEFLAHLRGGRCPSGVCERAERPVAALV